MNQSERQWKKPTKNAIRNGLRLAQRARAHRGARGGDRRRAVHGSQERALCARLSSRVHHCGQHCQARCPTLPCPTRALSRPGGHAGLQVRMFLQNCARVRTLTRRCCPPAQIHACRRGVPTSGARRRDRVRSEMEACVDRYCGRPASRSWFADARLRRCVRAGVCLCVCVVCVCTCVYVYTHMIVRE